MLNPERLKLAIRIQAQSYKLLRWVATAVENDEIAVESAERHSDTPDAAIEWIARNRLVLPSNLRPDEAHVREFANFFWSYVTSSFDVIPRPGTRLQPGGCGCMCPLCARITSAPHLQPKKLTKADKLRAKELMTERIAELSAEESLPIAPDRCLGIVNDLSTRRATAFSTYGSWLIHRLSGRTDGPAILALWREIAWTRQGSPIQGFSLRFEDFEDAENLLVQGLGSGAETGTR